MTPAAFQQMLSEPDMDLVVWIGKSKKPSGKRKTRSLELERYGKRNLARGAA